MKLIWLSLAALLAATCIDAWKTFKVLHGSNKSYAQWQTRCERWGGSLASINNAQEQATAAVVIKAAGKTVLTGMKRIKPHEHFINGAGIKLPYSNWNKGEPNDGNRLEPCLQIYSNGKWNDVGCRGNAALCQFEFSKGFVVLSGSNKPYARWQTKCKRQGGSLASINNAQEQAAAAVVIKAAGKTVLTGMKRIKPHMHFINGAGIKLPYSNWNRGEPNDGHRLEPCLQIYSNGKWNDIGCRGSAALCQFEALKTFVVLSGSTQSYAQWQAKCERQGGSLASINNALEQAAATVAIKAGGKTVLTGMKRIKPHMHFINGAGIKLPYSNWKRGEPNDGRNPEPCLEIYSNGKWNDAGCRGSAALCEFAPKLFFLVDVGGTAMSFNSWNVRCRAHGAQLARINNAVEQKIAMLVIKTSPRRSVLIDSKRKAKDSSLFQILLGAKITYSNWKKGEPNNSGGTEECTEVYVKGDVAGKWNDNNCNKATSALCQLRL